MTELDDQIRPEVLDIVQELGKAIEFRVTTEAYDVASGVTTPLSVQWVSVKCSPPSQYQISRDGEPDKLMETLGTLVPALGLTFEPKVEQIVRFDGRERRIVSVGKIYSGDLIAAFVLGLST